MLEIYDNITARLRASGDYVWPLLLRLILFWEFWESGITKFRGSNWFADIQEKFPFPFSALSSDVNWLAATWGEMVFAVMLLFGFLTRLAAFSLIVITVMATVTVHWPAEWGSLQELWKGYAISNKGFGNYKLPLLYTLMLLPLVFYGGGKLSLDHFMLKGTGRADFVQDRIGDWPAAGWAFALLGLTLVFLVPLWGYVLLGLALICFVMPTLRA